MLQTVFKRRELNYLGLFVVFLLVGALLTMGGQRLDSVVPTSTGDASYHTSNTALQCWQPCNSSYNGFPSNVSCWTRFTNCTTVTLEKRYQRCTDWYPDQAPGKKLRCRYTMDGVDAVTYITDPANYIDTPFDDADVAAELYTPGFKQPQDIEFFDDGKILAVPYGYGHLSVLDTNLSYRYSMNLNDVVAADDVLRDGLVAAIKGVAIDPNFEQNHYIYLYYPITNTSGGYVAQHDQNGWVFRIARFTLEDGRLSNQRFYANISGARWHSGGGVEIGTDGKLYVTIGDGAREQRAQRMDNLRGKILRLNRNGTVPASNPFEGSYVYTYGHRNPQGIAWNPATDTAFAAEHGGWRHDEVNILERGANYGWGHYSCDNEIGKDLPMRTDNYQSPVRCFTNFTMAPSRMTFVDDPGHPWHGDLFLAGLRGRHVRRFHMAGDTIEKERIFYVQRKDPFQANVSQRFRDIEYARGSLWIIGHRPGGLIRLSPR